MVDIQFKRSIDTGHGQLGEFVTHHQRKKDVVEFRNTHFIMGKHPPTMKS